MNTNNITAVLVDDEAKAIDNLSILLSEFCKNVTIIGTAQNVDKAVSIIETNKPDVVFLDIEMPKKSGFELFGTTKHSFQTIFVTAYNQYAIKAFEVSAIDYLLKPININRLQEAVTRIKVNKPTIDTVDILQENLTSETLKKITINYKDRYKIIDIDVITCIEANGSYCFIYYVNEKKLVRELYSKNLNYFDKLFENDNRFFRTHRSWLINTTKIKTFSKTSCMIQLKSDIEVPISRRKMKEFEELL